MALFDREELAAERARLLRRCFTLCLLLTLAAAGLLQINWRPLFVVPLVGCLVGLAWAYLASVRRLPGHFTVTDYQQTSFKLFSSVLLPR
jgi:hypothetical protein